MKTILYGSIIDTEVPSEEELFESYKDGFDYNDPGRILSYIRNMKTSSSSRKFKILKVLLDKYIPNTEVECVFISSGKLLFKIVGSYKINALGYKDVCSVYNFRKIIAFLDPYSNKLFGGSFLMSTGCVIDYTYDIYNRTELIINAIEDLIKDLDFSLNEIFV